MTCDFPFQDCVPVDDWETIIVCDNVNGNHDLGCEYKEIVGTVWSDSTSESMGIDYTISETISAGLFDIFSADIGISASTSYDWVHVTEETQQVATEIKVTLVAEPGTTQTLEQAVGKFTQLYNLRGERRKNSPIITHNRSMWERATKDGDVQTDYNHQGRRDIVCGVPA